MARPPFGRGTIVRDLPTLDLRPLDEGSEGLEVTGFVVKDWTIAGEDTSIIPSTARATAVRDTLKAALQEQLKKEAASIGGDIDKLAIHGRTGVST
jgi:hypothetical protein